MTNVIGTGKAEDWLCMRMLRENVAYMIKTNPEKYRLSIDKQREVYSDTLKEYAVRQEAAQKYAVLPLTSIEHIPIEQLDTLGPDWKTDPKVIERLDKIEKDLKALRGITFLSMKKKK